MWVLKHPEHPPGSAPVPDVCIRFDDNRTSTTDMINKTSGGKCTYEYKLNGDETSDGDEMSDVDQH